MNDPGHGPAILNQSNGDRPPCVSAHKSRRSVDGINHDERGARKAVGIVGGLLGEPARLRK